MPAEAATTLEEGSTIVIVEPEKEVEKKALPVAAQAKTVKVIDNTTMQKADEMETAIKAMIKEIDGVFKPIADKAFQAHRAITSKWNEIKAPLNEADAYLKGEVKTYLRKVEEARLAEQRRLEEEARQRAEEERLRQAEEAEKAGNVEEAEALIQEPVFVEPVRVVIETPKVDNRKYATRWKAEITDKGGFIVYVASMIAKGRELMKQGKRAESTVYGEYVQLLDVNMSALNQKARSMEDRFMFPGAKAYQE